MTAKPSYEELERRVQELEIIESDYKHLMEVSQENDSLFKRLYEKAPLGYQSLDENGHFLVVNPTWLNTLGYTKEEVIGKSFSDFLHPDWRNHFKENFPRFKSIGEVLGVEFEMVKKNGDPILVSFTGKISRDKKGNFQQSHCIFHDITERRRVEEDLQKEKTVLKAIIDSIPVMITRYDPNVNLLYLNKEFERIVGWKNEELNDINLMEEVYPDPAYRQIAHEYMEKAVIEWQEFSVRAKSGENVISEWSNICLEEGTRIGIGIDITERKQAEEALRQSEVRFKKMFRNHSAVMLLIEPESGVIIDANLAAEKFYGYSHEELLSINISHINTLSSEFIATERHAAREEKRNHFIFPHRLSGGEIRTVEVHTTPITVDNLTLLFSIIHDITKAKQAEDALRASELVHSKMIANIGDVIVIIDRNGINRYKSPNIEKWFGWRPADLVGFNTWDNVHPDDLEKGQTFLGALALKPNATGTTEVRYLCKDGSYKWIEIHIVNLLHDTSINGFLGNYHDITERKQTENAFKLVAESSFLSAQDIFPFLVRQIAVSQGMRYALIARVDPSDSTAHTMAVWCGDRYGENFSYALEGTPCNNVASEGVCFYPSNIQALFPHDQLLVDMGIESYWGTALRTSTGELLGVMAIMHDQPIKETPQIHALLQAFALRTSVEMERQQTEKLLRKNQEDLRKAQHIAKLGNWHLNIKSNQLVWSDELYRMYGFDPTLPPPLYTDLIKLFTPESWEKLSTAMQQTKDAGIPYDLELETLRIDGSHGWMWAHGMAEVDATNEIIGLRGVAQDITDRKQSEEALRESEARFKALHNASFGGITIHDKGIILECNQGLAEISGYSIDELIGMNGLQLISEKTRGMVLQNILDGYEKPYEAIGLRKNNEEYPLRLEARNIPYKGKNLRVVEFRDITEQKRQEEETNQLEAQLRQSQKMEAVGQLAGGVAHDFNNMLGVITGYSELILEQMDSTQQFHAELEEIQKAARRSADLIRQLLTFARKQTVAPKVLDLNQTIAGMLNMLRRLIGENIDLSWMPGFGLWSINMDPSQIDQILANLCVNARDAIAGVGKLTVETKNATFDKEYCSTHAGSLPGEYVRIAVSDTGSGMDKATLAHIFEPFFTTKGFGEGTGLGLATVYGAVKQNNGFINVYSEPGQGTTFTIYIPRHVETTTDMQTTASTEPVVSGDEIVLLVEDEPTLLQMSRTMLGRLGYTVLAAGTPSEAIRLAGEYSGQIHLLATDVIMPEMNGRELSLRLLESRPEMKCLYMSGYTANIIANQGVLKEGVSFIQKPFSKNELASKVREAMES